MSKGPLILWLVIELGRLCLTPAASQTVVRAFLGQPVTLPCTYSSWSPNSNSMCWGRGQCPKSKCNDELLYTDGTKVVSSKSPKYQLRGIIQRGDVSLTIMDTNEGDQNVYCCRIEVPGWFNDVKRNIRLDLRRAPTTTPSTTTRRPTTTTTTTVATTTAMTTATAMLPTTVVTTSDLTSTPPLQMRTTAALTTTASMCPLTTLSSLLEEDTILLTLEPSTEGPTLTAELEPALLPRTSQRSVEETSHRSTALLTSKTPETSFLVQNEVEPEQIRMTSNYDLLMIIAPSLGFVLLALLLAFFLRGKFVKANCFQKHTRLDNVGEGKDVLSGTEDEDGLFTL
ncbi:T-cell immunoglobulin and mucin domain-containing protein 4 precursor [Bos taurus]|uniref:Ig-like domain-containing protein n=1 Tax=Bos indicus x Bos taurus TaxID=30522 RepID=A0A4W2F1L6_BOBOX|nr:T-cell immunoglobulin and mucin domain-containing protein 4 precursor [Bos taurus]AAX08804.1 T-cell immunoglobulin and mucin domain containing 4 [Bos taurus]